MFDNPAVLDTPLRDEYDVFFLILNTREQRWPPEREALFARAVESGKGLFALHSAILGFRGWTDFPKLIGGRPRDSFYHPPYGPFIVHIDDASHPITHRMVGFALADELYADLEALPGAQVLAHAEHNGREHPLLWTVEHSHSRACYLALGHDRAALRAPEVLTLIRRGVAWVAGSKQRG
jgi:type 1 glutamine amidotransferase